MIRRHPNMSEKLASALLELQHLRALVYKLPHDHVIAFSEAQQMTAAQINSLFRADHSIHHAWGGSCHPCNITMRLIKASREHTAKVDAKQISKVKRISKRPERLMPVRIPQPTSDVCELQRIDVRGDKADTPKKREWPSRKIPSRSFPKRQRKWT